MSLRWMNAYVYLLFQDFQANHNGEEEHRDDLDLMGCQQDFKTQYHQHPDCTDWLNCGQFSCHDHGFTVSSEKILDRNQTKPY